MTDYTNTDIGEINTHRGREIHSIQTREREEERLNLLRDNDIDSNIWLKHRLPRERVSRMADGPAERRSPVSSQSEKRGGGEENYRQREKRG